VVWHLSKLRFIPVDVLPIAQPGGILMMSR
jgi:hypothetical protein